MVLCLLPDSRGDTGIPTPRKRNTFRNGGRGGVMGSPSSVSLLSMSLSEHRDGVVPSVTDVDGRGPGTDEVDGSDRDNDEEEAKLDSEETVDRRLITVPI